MLTNFTRFACLSLTLSSTMAATHPTAQGGASSLPLPYREIYQFSNDSTYIENIAVRQNGDLLITLLAPAAQLYLIQNPHSDSPSVSLVHSFGGGVEGLLGIAETKPDTFLVAGSSLSGQPNASAVFEVDFNHNNDNKARATPSTLLVANITEGLVLNGAAALPGCGREVVLVADSFLGQVFRIDARTGHYDVPIKSNTSVGINGLKIHDGHLYFSNSVTVRIYRLRIAPDGSPAEGAAVETVATVKGENFLDGFAIGADGTVWAASNRGSTVYAISPDGKAVVPVLGSADSTVVSGDTAAAFGRTEQDRHVLYVTTSRPGKVVAIDTSKYYW
ncbi:uncharacterized protein PG986_008183 [Apiospora aurea]|uniref:SMP-30/Gluconolactonase/LRE-like region domain-containing protein n=1 Tax=Apiospora aurea TaxID=335848 RepID=A0ABR1QG42_9PEZI